MCSDRNSKELDKVIYNLLAFYQGGITHGEAEKMPLPRLFRADENAARIAEERRQAQAEATRRKR